jgi:hypothetical protein
MVKEMLHPERRSMHRCPGRLPSLFKESHLKICAATLRMATNITQFETLGDMSLRRYESGLLRRPGLLY